MGLPSSEQSLSFNVIDIYRREGDKLAENWIFIDLLYMLAQQGDDVLSQGWPAFIQQRPCKWPSTHTTTCGI